MGGQLGFLYRQLAFRPQPIPSSVNLNGKTALITGANTGLGLEAAQELASHGLTRLILASRSIPKGDAARKEILAKSPQCEVQVWELDYESFDSIQRFGERAQTLDKLDIVILSAGVKYLEYVESAKTGHEAHVQVNHLGTAALSLLLLAPLQATSKRTGTPSRMTIVTSEVHFWTDFTEREASNIIAELNKPSSFKEGSIDPYNVSKLLNLLWMRELSTKIGGGDGNGDGEAKVIFNGVNPGLCASSLHRAHEGASAFNKMFAWSAEQGGHCLTDAAMGIQYEKNGQGVYISEQVIKKPSSIVLSPEGQKTQKRLFQETLAVLGAALPGVDLTKALKERQ